MSKYCLVGKLADEFKKRLASGEINPEKLAKMISSERREYFQTFLDEENAKNVNSLFERNILAKRRWEGMIKWAKEVGGIDKKVRRDLVTRIERMQKQSDGALLSPAEEKAFLQDLASTKLGVDVSFEEAQKITELSEIIEKAKAKDLTVEANRIEYGNKMLDMYDYVGSLKPGLKPMEHVANVANIPRALMATLDFSAPFRQGFGMIARKEFWSNLKPMFQAAFSEQAFRNFQADIITRESYDSMKKSGLRLTGLGDKLAEKEEAFMTNLVQKIPGVRPSERGYTMFLTKLRADVFDSLIQKASTLGEDVRPGSKASRDIANMINNFTGAGRLINRGADTATPIANAVFFSPRLIAANIQKLNPVNYLDPRISPTARKEALKSLIAMIGASTTALYLAKLSGADVETDPRSSDFGKFKVGDTRFDVTGGVAGYVTLLSRLTTGEVKSTSSDIVQDMSESGFDDSRGKRFVQFFRNKMSPLASYVADWAYGENAIGEEFKADKALVDRVVPLIISDTIEIAQNDPDMVAPVFLASLFGVGTNTFNNKVDWNNKTGKELSQFRDKVGQEKFDEANEKYNEAIYKKIEMVLDDERYKNLDSEAKQKIITKIKDQEKQKIYNKYHFKYKQGKQTNEEKKLIREIAR